MVFHRWLSGTFLTLGCMVSMLPCYALDASDIHKLKIGGTLTMAHANTQQSVDEISITHINPVRSDSTTWYQINGTGTNGQDRIFYVDFTTSPVKMESVIQKLILGQLVNRPRKFLDAVEESEKGSLTFNDETYQYLNTESDEGIFEPDGDKTQSFEFNYLVFGSQKEAGLSIQVMRWSDEKFDTYLVKLIQATDVKIK
jgi:hypothetical protein